MLLLGAVVLVACSDGETARQSATSTGSGGSGATSSSSAGGGTGAAGGDGAGASGGDAVTGTIACGTGPCELPLEVCCTEMGMGSCVAGACPRGQGTAVCDGPEDCPQGACCVTGGFSTACFDDASACGGQEIVCHAPRDCPSSRPMCCQLFDDNYSTCTDNPAAPCN